MKLMRTDTATTRIGRTNTKWTMGLADAILKENYNGFNNMRYDPIEDDSELIFPSVAYESQPVLGEYALKAGQRVTEILQYGQDADVLKSALRRNTEPGQPGIG